ncbi:MAG: MarC family protein [Alphaproteobacteria bacterium]|nr:MAG: MarC family protein [Alphaproteobacteria bacterium]
MWDIFISAFAMLFVVVDPLGIAPIFVGLTAGGTPAYRRRMAMRGVAIATAVLVFFTLFGKPFLAAMGITLAALKVAGGVMLFVLALEMVFERRSGRRESTAERVSEEHPSDISVFPLAVPLLAGPGAITSVILLAGQAGGMVGGLVGVLVALGAVLLLSLVIFLAAERLVSLMGATVASVLSRVLGIVLAALAAQFALAGIRDFF